MSEATEPKNNNRFRKDKRMLDMIFNFEVDFNSHLLIY